VLSQWPHLSDFDKTYYLIGRLKGSAADGVRGISVSGDNYNLLWSTLAARFHQPRLVAASLIDKMLSAPSFTQETHPDVTFNVTCHVVD